MQIGQRWGYKPAKWISAAMLESKAHQGSPPGLVLRSPSFISPHALPHPSTNTTCTGEAQKRPANVHITNKEVANIVAAAAGVAQPQHHHQEQQNGDRQ